MFVRVACPHCGAPCNVADEHRGKRLLCPACNKQFQIVANPEPPANTPVRPKPATSRPRPVISKSPGPSRGNTGRPVIQTTYSAYYRHRRRAQRRRKWLFAGSAAALILIGAGVAFLVFRPKAGAGSPATVVARKVDVQQPVSAPAAVPSSPADPKTPAPVAPGPTPTTQPATRSQPPEAPQKSGPAPEKTAPAIQAKPRPPEKETPKKPATSTKAPAPAAQAGSPPEDPKLPPLKSLLAARQAGWQVVLTILPTLEAGDPKLFPGNIAFAKDIRAWENKIAGKPSPEQWPSLDVDALVKHNGNFWRASFEIAPGDTAVFLTHAGLLLTAGDALRAWQILTLARQRPGIPKIVLPVLEQLRMQAAAVVQEGEAKVNAGIKRFDAGDRKEALRLYKEAAAEWPQNSNAHYELGFTMFVEAEVAAGRPVPKMGTVVTTPGKHSDFSPEVVRQLALARKHNPLEYMAYQGSDRTVINRLLPLMTKVLPRWKKIMEADKAVEDATLADFSDACQEVALDDLALASRQLLAARRNRYMPADLAFLRTSLERTAPSPQTEATLKALAGATMTVRTLMAPEQANVPGPDPSKAADMKLLRLYVPGPEMPKRIGKDVLPIGNYVKALLQATDDYLQKAARPEAKGLLIAVGIKAGKKSKVWCQAVDGKAPVDLLRGLEKVLEKVEPIALEKAPMAFGMEIVLWGQQVSAFPQFPDVWQEAAKKTKSKLLIPPDELFQLLWPD